MMQQEFSCHCPESPNLSTFQQPPGGCCCRAILCAQAWEGLEYEVSFAGNFERMGVLFWKHKKEGKDDFKQKGRMNIRFLKDFQSVHQLPGLHRNHTNVLFGSIFTVG